MTRSAVRPTAVPFAKPRAPARLAALCVILAACAVNVAAQSARAAGLKAVVFDIEPAGDPLSPQIAARLKGESDSLRQQLAARGLMIVDTAPQADKIKTNSPLSQCNGCDQDIAKALGADIEIATAVQPTSAAESALSASVKDVKTDRTLRSGVVNIRGTDDNEWSHGVKFLVRERLLSPPLPSDVAGLRKLVDSASPPKE